MKPVIESVAKIIDPSKVHLDDFVGRFCSRYTPMLLGLFICITATVDYFGRPISCMLPAEYSEVWASYVHQYCFVTGTYVKKETFEPEEKESTREYVHYYQWVPFVIIVQALAFSLPYQLWRFGQRLPDVDFNHVNQLCCEARKTVGEKRAEKLDEVADYIYQTQLSRGSGGIGCLASYIYFAYKLLNIAVVYAQIHFLNIFVGYNNADWGITLAKWSWSNRGWQDNFSYFPRLAYCEFGRDFLGNFDGSLVSEVRCVLSVNMLNEKVFMVLFFWFYGLLLLTIFNSICFSGRFLPTVHVANVRSFLGLLDSIDRRVVRQLANDVLGQDGELLLRFVRQNSGFLVAKEIGSRLYAKMPK